MKGQKCFGQKGWSQIGLTQRRTSNTRLKQQLGRTGSSSTVYSSQVSTNLSNKNLSPYSSVFTEAHLCSYFSMLPGPSYLAVEYNINLLTNLVSIPLDFMHNDRSHLISLNLL